MKGTRNKFKKFFLPLALLTGGALLFYKKGFAAVSAKNLNIKLRGVDFLKKEIIMTITNPYNGNITVDNITGDVIFNNNNLATVAKTLPFDILANQSKDVKIPFKINNFDALGILLDVLKLPKAKIKDYFIKGNLNVKGTVNSSGLLVDFDVKIK